MLGVFMSSCGIKGKPVPPKSSTEAFSQTTGADSVSATTTVTPVASAPIQKSKNKKK